MIFSLGLNKYNFVVLGLILIFLCLPALATEKHAGILLADPQGKILYAQNRDKHFTPASILKILTSLAAVDHWGMDYRFTTLFAYDRSSKNLYIKGLGDPLFVSEVIQDLCKKIIETTQAGTINDILIDQGFFAPDIRIPGTGNSLNPYDATTGALCANFNTLSFKWDATLKQYSSAEPQTPLLLEFLGDIKASGQKQGRILLSPDQRRAYPGLLVKFFLEKRGMAVTGRVRQGILDEGHGKVNAFESPFTLEDIIQKLLKHSNNFMANQLLLCLGADTASEPATLDKGVAALETFARKKLGLTNFTIEEGSGLSRGNQISPEQMLKVLKAFMPFHGLLTVDKNEYYKTGTLSDVRCRAGYIRGPDKGLYPFVIMINQKDMGYDAIRKDLHSRVERIR